VYIRPRILCGRGNKKDRARIKSFVEVNMEPGTNLPHISVTAQFLVRVRLILPGKERRLYVPAFSKLINIFSKKKIKWHQKVGRIYHEKKKEKKIKVNRSLH
jgi:hypothetical protein